ncbi:hypothetical protein CS022_01695 [Veronia nyctiphanis]|uniref:Outer membrane protein beta-barrel domain-containing protein n=1 Tax=Veronia nyctiphanis TaxID=1278244 RepID=A0A4Q0YVK4_9GAMM|nr:outer membrane beta-barrel protein [Veronia nyctiphanis]RXJ74923.1 hypothetical protein CS022_01695 [Veronia nyctiphanis]
MKITRLCPCVILITSLSASADDFSGWHVNAGAGLVYSTVNNKSFESQSTPDAFSISGGYQLNRFIGVEATLIHYGKMQVDGFEARPRSLSISANLGYELENGIRPFILFGYGAFKLGQSDSLLRYIAVNDEARTLHTGFGVEYQLENVYFRVSQVFDKTRLTAGIGFFEDSLNDKFSDITLATTQLTVGYQF